MLSVLAEARTKIAELRAKGGSSHLVADDLAEEVGFPRRGSRHVSTRWAWLIRGRTFSNPREHDSVKTAIVVVDNLHCHRIVRTRMNNSQTFWKTLIRTTGDPSAIFPDEAPGLLVRMVKCSGFGGSRKNPCQNAVVLHDTVVELWLEGDSRPWSRSCKLGFWLCGTCSGVFHNINPTPIVGSFHKEDPRDRLRR